VSEAIICEKSKLLYSDITRDTPGSGAEEFKASKVWFDNFKKRTGIHTVVRHGEDASSNKNAAEKFVEKFKHFVDRNGFIPEQVFNCDETGLFWKKMTKMTQIKREEKASFYGICLTFKAVISLHYTFYFYFG